MRRLLFTLAFVLGLAMHADAGKVFTAATCNDTGANNVQAKLNRVSDNPSDPDTVIIPAGNCKWSTGVSISNKSVIMKGAGDGSATSPCPCTVIADNVNGKLVTIQPAVGNKVRVSGIKFTGGTGSGDPGFLVSGPGGTPERLPQLRLDRLTFSSLTNRNHMVWVINVVGVADHVTCTVSGLYCFLVEHPGWNGSADGHGSFAAATNLGSANAFYVEDSDYSGGGTGASFVDGSRGARIVARKSRLTNSQEVVHGTETGFGNARGTRSLEFYGNVLNYSVNWGSSVTFRSGTGVVFNNSNSYSAGSGGPYVAITNNRNSSSNFEAWGGCDGTGPYDDNDTTGGASGNGIYASWRTLGAAISGSGDLTLVIAGNPWTTNQFASRYAATVYSVINLSQLNQKRFHPSSIIVSNASNGTTTTVTLQDGANHGNAFFKPGDHWEIRSARICIDQPGRGQSNQLTPGAPPRPQGWVRNALEPIYVFNNTPAVWKFGEADMAGGRVRVALDRDFYVTNACAGKTACGNGIGVGTRPQMDAITTCTQGVGFWVTNEGSWNQSNDGQGNGQLYVCGASNNWVLYYTPFTYPHRCGRAVCSRIKRARRLRLLRQPADSGPRLRADDPYAMQSEKQHQADRKHQKGRCFGCRERKGDAEDPDREDGLLRGDEPESHGCSFAKKAVAFLGCLAPSAASGSRAAVARVPPAPRSSAPRGSRGRRRFHLAAPSSAAPSPSDRVPAPPSGRTCRSPGPAAPPPP